MFTIHIMYTSGLLHINMYNNDAQNLVDKIFCLFKMPQNFPLALRSETVSKLVIRCCFFDLICVSPRISILRNPLVT